MKKTKTAQLRKSPGNEPAYLTASKKSNKSLVPVVGIGASAGGLEAFHALLLNLPNNTGMAFVFIQHLDPGHKSMLSDLLSKSTVMPVLEAKSGMKISPNHVYIIPPNAIMGYSKGALQVT